LDRDLSPGNPADGIDIEPAARLAKLRSDHPDAKLSTELLRFDERTIVVRAEISLPSGAGASGMAAVPSDRTEAVVAAETRAISRALMFFGYGAVETAVITPAATPSRPQPIEPKSDQIARAASRPETPASPPPLTVAVEPPPAKETPVRAAETGRPLVASTPAVEPQPRSVAQPQSPAQPVPVAVEADPPMEDFSWTAFWNWARKLGYQSKPGIEEAIGQSITSLSPAQVRTLLREKTGVEG
jgi:hypothetical protein